MIADENLPDALLPHHFAWTDRLTESNWRVAIHDPIAPDEVGAIVAGTISEISPSGELVRRAVADIVDAAGGLEYSRIQLERTLAVAQDEFDVLQNWSLEENGVKVCSLTALACNLSTTSSTTASRGLWPSRTATLTGSIQQ